MNKFALVLATLFLHSCAQPQTGKSIPSAGLNSDGWIEEKNYYEKVVHYGTTRKDQCDRLDPNSYKYKSCLKNLYRLDTGNSDGENEIRYGRVTVKIPFVKSVGGTTGMSISSINHNIDFQNFVSGLADDDLLVFIHGFNTPFTDAAIRSAQLAHDTNFSGRAVLYSWPSGANPLEYKVDKDRAEENFEQFSDFLEKLSSNKKRTVHVVAHSMGTYILMNSLAKISARTRLKEETPDGESGVKTKKLFGQIILAAPDIAQDDYYHTFSTYDFQSLADRITLYSSLNDHVLTISKYANISIEGASQPRLGKSDKNFFVVDGMDTVDTRQEIAPQFFGHSFYANYRSLVADIHLLLKYGASPGERMLQPVIDRNQQQLWFIRN